MLKVDFFSLKQILGVSESFFQLLDFIFCWKIFVENLIINFFLDQKQLTTNFNNFGEFFFLVTCYAKYRMENNEALITWNIENQHLMKEMTIKWSLHNMHRNRVNLDFYVIRNTVLSHIPRATLILWFSSKISAIKSLEPFIHPDKETRKMKAFCFFLHFGEKWKIGVQLRSTQFGFKTEIA